MMTYTEALITTARRYLGKNHGYWANKYSKERTGEDDPYTYTDSDYNLFPRFNVLSAILGEVETLVNQNRFDLETCKRELIRMGLTANNMFTTGEHNDIALNAMEEERFKFKEFIDNTTLQDLEATEPLPYRRRLLKNESEKIRERLFQEWNFQGNYWEPIEKLSGKPTIFFMKENITSEDYEHILKEIKNLADEKIFEMTEDGSDAEIEFSLLHPDCYETIYCDKNFNWIMYGSHEDTLAFGGDPLLKVIENLFKNRPGILNTWR